MEKNQNGKHIQQSDSKPNQQSAQNSPASPKDMKEGEENSAFQRRPQFRLHENSRKRYI